MQSSLTRLSEGMDDFSPTEKRIAAYLLKHAEGVLGTSIGEVAQACQTGKSSVVQLCKKAGFKGYKDFCHALSAELALKQQAEMKAHTDIHPGFSVGQICHVVASADIRCLTRTLEIVSTVTIEAAVEALCNASQIQLFGVGNSAIVALDAQNKLRRIGMNAFFSLDIHCQLLSVASLKPGDVALIFSYLGETRDILEAVHQAKELGATVISVTKYGQNTTASLADVALYVAGSESRVRSAAMASRMSMLLVVDMLFTCIASRRHDEIGPILENTNKIALKFRQ